VLREKFIVIESTASTEKDEVKKDLEELKNKTKEDADALHDKIDAVDSIGKQRVLEVNEKTNVVQAQVKSFRKWFFISKSQCFMYNFKTTMPPDLSCLFEMAFLDSEQDLK